MTSVHIDVPRAEPTDPILYGTVLSVNRLNGEQKPEVTVEKQCNSKI